MDVSLLEIISEHIQYCLSVDKEISFSVELAKNHYSLVVENVLTTTKMNVVTRIYLVVEHKLLEKIQSQLNAVTEMHINGQHIYEILAKPEKQLLPFKVNALLMPPTNVFEMLTGISGNCLFESKKKHYWKLKVYDFEFT